MDEDGAFLSTLLDLILGSNLLEGDHKLLGVVLGDCKELGRVKRKNVVGNDIWALRKAAVSGDFEVGYSQVRVVNAETVVEPVDLTADELGRHEAGLGEDLGDLGLLVGLLGEGGSNITTV